MGNFDLEGFLGALTQTGLNPIAQRVSQKKQAERQQQMGLDKMQQVARLKQQQEQQDLARRGEVFQKIYGDQVPEGLGTEEIGAGIQYLLPAIQQKQEQERAQQQAEQEQAKALGIYQSNPELQQMFSPQEFSALGAKGAIENRLKAKERASQMQASTAKEQRAYQRQLQLAEKRAALGAKYRAPKEDPGAYETVREGITDLKTGAEKFITYKKRRNQKPQQAQQALPPIQAPVLNIPSFRQ